MPATGARGGWLAAAPVLCAVAVGACGSSGAALKAPCQTGARAVVARELGVAPAKVSAVESTGSNGSPQCTYAAWRRSVLANINVTPQAYFIVERTAVEASQQFAPIPASKLPVQVPHIGLDAYWYPAFSQFETTDGVRVIQITVTIPRARQAREIAVGAAVSRPYLGKLHPPP
jgi:hypothetical protein